LQKQIRHCRKLALPASRQHGDDRRLAGQAQLLAHDSARWDPGEQIRKRMADVCGVDTRFLVELCLEGKHGEHAGDRAADFVDPFLAPHPDRRADVVHGGNAPRLQLRLERQVEIGRVDADERARRVSPQMLRKPAPDGDDFGQVAQHLNVAAHGQLFEGEKHFQARSFHARAADAGEAKGRVEFAQGADQFAAEQVARRLAGDHGDHRCRGTAFSG
jgi:hypothetical protein